MRIAVYLVLSVLVSLLIADRYYIKALHAAPIDAPTYNMNDLDAVIAELSTMQRRAKHDEAILLIHDAQKIHGEQWTLLLALSESLLAKENNTSAIDQLNRVLELQPEQERALSLRARCLRDVHRIDDALKDIQRILAKNPKDESGLFLRGTIEFAREEYEKAIDSFTQSLETNPKSLSTLYNRAQCYAELNQFEKARADMIVFVEQSEGGKLKETAIGILKEWQNK